MNLIYRNAHHTEINSGQNSVVQPQQQPSEQKQWRPALLCCACGATELLMLLTVEMAGKTHFAPLRMLRDIL